VYYGGNMIYRVELSKHVQKQLQKLPRHIVENLAAWVDDIEDRGLEEVRKILGYHDEPLQGKRLGERSIRLSRAYRAIYRVCSSDSIEFVLVEEISRHEY
jgi:toxin HigB-1